ncbi:MAG: tRNA (guanosine(46)-N7)-methyltransferase TrmB [Fusobacteriales bacterium]|nr:MAG: tRNA (guanosine(46)-N7)-methyltransferase TrmB [Fusobacteriales bacterium]
MKEKTKTFISKRLEQDFSFLGKEDNLAREHAPLSNLNKEEYIWVHCSSVGEVNLSESLVKKFHSVFKKNILLSVFTDTGYENAKKKYAKYDKIKVIYFPLDEKKKILEILSYINLKLLVLIETEIWFNLINECKKNKARVIVVNGRISEKSFKNYSKIKFLLKSLFKKIDYFYMQTENDKNRIISLGANENKVENVGNLKFDINLEKYSKEDLEEYKKFLKLEDENKKIFVAGSTRTGEDEILLEVFSQLKDCILILVPRHLERLPKIEKLIEQKSFKYIKYSELKKNINKKFDIILVDEMGVLKKLYAICDVAFVGGTLVNVGGHNLLEPLFYRKPLIFGKYLQNVKDISQEILKRKIGYCVKNSKEFIKVINNTTVTHTDNNSPRVESMPQALKREVKENNLEYIGCNPIAHGSVSAIDKFFEENKLLSLKIVKKENKIMNLKENNITDDIEEKKKNLWKHFFHSPRTNYNIYMMKLLDYPNYIIYDNEIMKVNKNKWNEYFKNNWEIELSEANCSPIFDKKLALEIGSGSGNFVSKLAVRNKDKNYLALELRFKRLCLAAKKCKRQNLNNVIFLRKRAEELLDFLGENEIEELYINFPDPWEGNEKNRVIQERLFINLEKIMKKDGMIFFKTDHDIYYQDVLNLVNKLENFEVIYHTNDLHNSEKAEENIKTEFEELFLNKHNKNINYIEIRKTI